MDGKWILEFSSRSLSEIDLIADYIELKWSVKSKDKFLERLRKNIELIKSNPKLFPVSNYENLHKCVVSKQTTVFYVFDDKKIYIVTVFDTRQNPKKIKKVY